MICFDTSVLVDYLRGEEYVEQLLDGTNESVGVPQLARYELYVGAERSDDPNETPSAVADALAWTETLGFTDDVARDAAAIRATLLDAGAEIGVADTLIAGTARNASATLVACDDHFQRVPDLAVHLVDRSDIDGD